MLCAVLGRSYTQTLYRRRVTCTQLFSLHITDISFVWNYIQVHIYFYAMQLLSYKNSAFNSSPRKHLWSLRNLNPLEKVEGDGSRFPNEGFLCGSTFTSSTPVPDNTYHMTHVWWFHRCWFISNHNIQKYVILQSVAAWIISCSSHDSCFPLAISVSWQWIDSVIKPCLCVHYHSGVQYVSSSLFTWK